MAAQREITRRVASRVSLEKLISAAERGYADEQNMGERHRQHQNDRCDEGASLRLISKLLMARDFNGAGMTESAHSASEVGQVRTEFCKVPNGEFPTSAVAARARKTAEEGKPPN